MSLPAGARLGPYEVLALLGAGGMGEVYEARDPRLNRHVALKVLPAQFVADVTRRQRFVREAQLASALQHPHIVTIYDIGSADGRDYIAMELVRGRTLESVIAKGRVRLSEAVRYATEIVDALAAAHGAGIVHRDLKPGNVMVTEQGSVKVLDFGLATLVESGGTFADDETRAARAALATSAGTVLGTVAYMSPEQAEGKKVDARSDLFSFGAMLYEMLGGQRAFRAGSAPATLAAVIGAEPTPLPTLAPDVPHALDRLVARCLRKDVARRAQHASDVKVALEEIRDDLASGSVAVQPSPSRPRRGAIWAAAAVGAVALGATAIWWPRVPRSEATFEPTPLTSLPGSERHPSFSPDGSQIAFTWERDGESNVYVQVVGSVSPPLPITRDAGVHIAPSWSPDGKFVALWHQLADRRRALSLISPLGGPERPLAEFSSGVDRISWSPDGRWLAVSSVTLRGTAGQGVVLVSSATGERVEWATLDPVFSSSEDPAFSPDGRRLAFVHRAGDGTGEVYLASVGEDGKPAGTPTRLDCGLTRTDGPTWTADGQTLLLVEAGDLLRVQVDEPCRPQRIARGVGPIFAVSKDGTRLALPVSQGDTDIQRIDLAGKGGEAILAHSTTRDSNAEYSPDGLRVVFKSAPTGANEIWVADADGQNALQLTQFGAGSVFGTFRWSPDGQHIAFDRRVGSNSEIFVLPSGGGSLRQVTNDGADEARPAWSSDGTSIYFSSSRSGRAEIWKSPATGGETVQVTRNGGYAVLASQDGWLYYTVSWSAPVRRVRVDGTADAVVIDQPILGSMFALTSHALWFVACAATAPRTCTVNTVPFGGGGLREAARLDFEPEATALSVSPDERYALVTRPDGRGTDLMLIDHFR